MYVIECCKNETKVNNAIQNAQIINTYYSGKAIMVRHS